MQEEPRTIEAEAVRQRPVAESQFVDEPDPFLFVEIFQDLGQSVGFQDPVEFLPFREGKPEKGVCDVASGKKSRQNCFAPYTGLIIG